MIVLRCAGSLTHVRLPLITFAEVLYRVVPVARERPSPAGRVRPAVGYGESIPWFRRVALKGMPR